MATLTFKDHIRIHASPADVWCFLEDPDMLKLWCPKLQQTTLVDNQRLRAGTRFQSTYDMRGKTYTVDAHVQAADEPSRLVMLYTGGCLGDGGSARESIELPPTEDDWTALTRRVEIIDARISLWCRLLIRVSNLIGRPIGRTNLQELKQLVESSSQPMVDHV